MRAIAARFSGLIALLAAAGIFSIFNILIRILSDYTTTEQQVGLRGMTGFVAAILVVIVGRRSFSSIRTVSKKYLFFYAISFPIAIFLFTSAVTQTTVALTIASFYIATLLTSLALGVIFFKEKINAQKIVALGILIVAMGLLVFPLDPNKFNFALILGLAAGALDAITNSFRKYFSTKIDRFVLTAIQMFAIFVLGVILTVPAGVAVIPMGLPLVIWLIAIVYGVLLMCISLLLLHGFSKIDLNVGTVVLSAELFLAPLFAWLLLNENPQGKDLLAAILVFIAVIVTSFDVLNIQKLLKLIGRSSEPRKDTAA